MKAIGNKFLSSKGFKRNIHMQSIAALLIILFIATFFVYFQSKNLKIQAQLDANNLALQKEKGININKSVVTSFGHSFENDKSISKQKIDELSARYISKFDNNHRYMNNLIIETALIIIFGILLFGALLFFEVYVNSKNKDIQELIEIKNEILRREKRFKLALNRINDVFWEWDIVTNRMSFSEKWMELTGYQKSEEDKMITFLNDIIYKEDMKKLTRNLKNYLRGKTNFFECDFRLKDSKNNLRWFYVKGIYQDEDISSRNLVGFLGDITKKKNIEEKINYMAYYDVLTGLPNRGLFLKYLKEAVDRCVENKELGALIFLDLDDFKIVNDTLGHDYGDQLLKIISNILKATLGEKGVISRIGGDEFLILIDNFQNRSYLNKVCKNIIELFKNPFEIGDKYVYTSISMGISIFPEDSTDLNELLKNADTAMYKSKEDGKNKFCFFDSNMRRDLERKTQVGNLLREAVSKNELYMVYQPLYYLGTSSIIGVEALLRWRSKELGEVLPGEFIPISEKNGTITTIGRWVFEEVCRQNREWKDKEYKYKAISVNISSIQIQDEGFVDYIRENIINNKIEPGAIELEITETLLMSNISVNEKKLNELKKTGVKIAIDDFGTGYSSLNYLKNLPINTLKIDKSFIDNITSDYADRILTENIINLSHDLNIKVVAEGVETKEQLEILRKMKCDVIQGYYFSKPLKKEAMELRFIELNDKELQKIS